MVLVAPKSGHTHPVVIDKSCGRIIDDVSTRQALDRVLKVERFALPPPPPVSCCRPFPSAVLIYQLFVAKTLDFES